MRALKIKETIQTNKHVTYIDLGEQRATVSFLLEVSLSIIETYEVILDHCLKGKDSSQCLQYYIQYLSQVVRLVG